MDDSLYHRFFSEQTRYLPYTSSSEHLQDLWALLDILCWGYSEYNHNESAPYTGRGAKVDEALFYHAFEMVATEPMDDAQAALRHIHHRQMLTKDVQLPYAILCQQFTENFFQAFCLLLALAPHFNRKYESIFAYLQNGASATRPTLGLAADLFGLLEPLPDDTLYGMTDETKDINHLLLLDQMPDYSASVLSRTLIPQTVVLEAVTGQPHPQDREWQGACTTLPFAHSDLEFHQAAREECCHFLEQQLRQPQGSKLIYLEGATGVGKSFTLSCVSRALNLPICEVDLRPFSALSSMVRRGLLQSLTIQCLINQTLPCLLHREQTEGQGFFMEAIAALLPYFPALLLSGTGIGWLQEKNHSPLYIISLPKPTQEEQCLLWEYYLNRHNLTIQGATPLDLTSRYRLSPRDIAQTVSSLADEQALHPQIPITTEQIAKMQCRTTQILLGSIATHLKSPFKWEDLQIPEQPMEMLKQAKERILMQYCVQTQWGFAQRLPYGRGISILLYGPPGTGKTMAAQVLSNAVDIDLFRVDLSQIVDKYIGETEKKLGQLFDTAQKTNCILFFDEADALFAKRSQVNDSKDKYANIETSYLLQRIEAYDGITILATNNLSNFDSAFRRRIHYFIEVPMPSVAVRQRLWEQVFPPQVPIAPNVDFADLAERFELSGSSIKSIALAAAYRATAEGAVSRFHILEQIRLEDQKNGKLEEAYYYY